MSKPKPKPSAATEAAVAPEIQVKDLRKQLAGIADRLSETWAGYYKLRGAARKAMEQNILKLEEEETKIRKLIRELGGKDETREK